MGYFSVDRIEEGKSAVLVDDDGKQQYIPLALLPAGTREGDVLALVGGEYHPAPEETQRRHEQVQKQLGNLLGR